MGADDPLTVSLFSRRIPTRSATAGFKSGVGAAGRPPHMAGNKMRAGDSTRRSLRLPHYDYAAPGAYFLTLRTAHWASLFGRVEGNTILLSPIGRTVEEEWLRTPTVRPEIALDDVQVTPNHFHAIFVYAKPTNTTPVPVKACQPPLRDKIAARTISTAIAGFKAVVTLRVRRLGRGSNAPVWQRSFFERVVRDEDELNRIREYVRRNPLESSIDPANTGTRPSGGKESLRKHERRQRDKAYQATG